MQRTAAIGPACLLFALSLAAQELPQSASVKTVEMFRVGAFQPRLTITRTASGVEVSWPAAATDDGYAIQTSATLGPSADWQAPGATPIRNGSRDVLAIVSPSGNAFFRLKK